MADETDMNEQQAESGEASDSSDVPDLHPAERLDQSLEQLEEQGELDSDRVTFRANTVSGVSLNEIRDILYRVGFDDYPVTVTIDHDGDGTYEASFEYGDNE